MIEPALEDLRTKFQSTFGVFGGSSLMTDATPRRLVLVAKDLEERAPDVQAVVPGPYVSAGEKAAQGFARKWNTSVSELGKTADAKGERFIFHQLIKGQPLAAALTDKLPEIIADIHFPKTMYW